MVQVDAVYSFCSLQYSEHMHLLWVSKAQSRVRVIPVRTHLFSIPQGSRHQPDLPSLCTDFP